jgi:hypothetical protein|tara:strand:- start:314 stop:694 length:381 start_codon:yes stop_codon:yes gene_type:complete
MAWTNNEFDGKNINIHHAIESLASKDSMWTLNDNDWSTLYWDSENSQAQPTLDEIKAEIQRLQTEYDAKEYVRKRTRENDGTTTAYAEISEQMAMIYDDIIAGKLDSTGKFCSHNKKVKDENPKPS